MFISILLLFTLAACTGNFEEYNTDNNGFTDEQKNYDYNQYGILLEVVQQGIYFNYDWGGGKNWPFQVMQNLNIDMFCGYFHIHKQSSNSVYNLNDGWNATLWENTYGYILPEIIKTETSARDEFPEFYAIAKILKVLVMHRITDVYGPIIYSRFGESNTGALPDTQQEVYYSFFTDLEEAIGILSAHTGQESFERFDMLMPANKKNYAQWIRFANSLRLRLAIRIATADPEKAKTEVQKSLMLESGGLLESKEDVVAVSTAGTGYLNPLGEINKLWKEVYMNASMESLLVGYEDPRLPAYFESATGYGYTGEYHGIRQGTDFNHLLYGEHSRSTISQTTDAILMTAAEVWFLRAEAALRGWSSEDVESCYKKGIETSFDQWNVTGVVDYLISEKTPSGYTDTFTPEYNIPAQSQISPAWDAHATNEIKLEKIITQKWLACYPEGCEAWAEQRRTGYPRLYPVLVNKSEG
ncbi:MAG: SusD/RagB family nutrient-binding outer membrane lipoprotein, partial [Tannerellaceae bacterium]|nr:SusD/RagB family nutrient-binding outer membrane lipoprotein [Tannerellaceae bacterium]